MGDVTNKQHYVFQAYLKRWGQRPWVLRLADEKMFQSSTDDILSKRRMYKLHEMNEDEKIFFEVVMLALKSSTEEADSMRNHIEIMQMPHLAERIVDSLERLYSPIIKEGRGEEIENIIESNRRTIQKTIINSGENFHSSYESDGIKWINRLCSGDADFYCDPGTHLERDDFLSFVSIQFFRTIGMRRIMSNYVGELIDLMKNYKNNKPNINYDNVREESIVPHLSWIFQGRLAASLSNKGAKLQIMWNKTRLPFITSDQPVINMKAEPGKEASELVLYYPIDPFVAITINGAEGKKDLDTTNIIDDLNRMMVKHAHEYVVADRKGILEGMMEMISR